ncbi:MAG: hypothetical protein A2Y53_03875 [Chloroflexi bacterium RBG_16_47_49]|nr:MAG: hypothetical protein A2Y53_03875 [Chloroflexi bacterium RBG_16_47_49]
MDWKKLWEYLKEPARWLAIGIVAYLIDVIVPIMKPEWIPFLIMALRFADKWLHDIGKVEDSKTLTAGLTRF